MQVNTCCFCKFWLIPDADHEYGKCLFLSGETTKESPCPDPKDNTGVLAWPVCWHDGAAVDFQTTGQFGCIHFTNKGEG